jgi:hypothetical protein
MERDIELTISSGGGGILGSRNEVVSKTNAEIELQPSVVGNDGNQRSTWRLSAIVIALFVRLAEAIAELRSSGC